MSIAAEVWFLAVPGAVAASVDASPADHAMLLGGGLRRGSCSASDLALIQQREELRGAGGGASPTLFGTSPIRSPEDIE